MEFPFLLYALSIPGPGEWENPKDEDPRELKSEIVNWGLRLKAVEPPLRPNEERAARYLP